MAESFSVKALLSAKDVNFSSAMRSASSAAESFKSLVGGGLGFGVLTGIGQQAFSAITSGISGMVGELNSSSAAWKTFTGNMRMNGKAEGEIKSIKKELQSFAEQTIYSSSDMASTFAQLDAVGTKNTTSLVKGFGGLAAAAENPTQAMKTLSTQATQMAAKPTVAWMDFKLMLEQTPAGIAAVAKEMGMSTGELVKNVQDGTVATDDFFAAVAKVGTNDSFTKLATEYKTVDQAMDGLRETAANKLQPAFDSLSAVGIRAVSGIVDKLGEINGDAVAGKIMTTFDAISGYWKTFSSAISDTGAFKAVQSAVVNFGSAVSHVFSSIASSGALKAIGTAIGNIVKVVSNASSAVSKFIADMNPKLLTGILGGLIGVKAGFKAFNFLKSFNPFGIFKGKAEESLDGVTSKTKGASSKIGNILKSLGTSVSTMAKGIGTGISTAMQGAGKGISTAFKGIGSALKMVNPVTLLALGGAIAIVTAGFTLLATQGEGVSTILQGFGTAISIVFQGIGTAIGTIIESIAPLAGQIAPLVESIGTAFGSAAPFVIALGAAISMTAAAIGNAVSQIIVAVTPVVQIISDTFTKVAQIIGDTIVGIVMAIEPMLPAITSAFTEITTVVSNAVVQIVQALAPYVPELTKMVQATAEAIQSVCAVFSTLISQISPIIQSVSDLISQFGDTVSQILASVGDVVTDVGDSISEVFNSIGDVISSVGESIKSVLDGIADIINSVGESARNAGEGFKLVAEGITLISELSIADIAKSLGAVALGLGEIAGKGNELQTAAAGMTGINKSITMASASVSTLNALFAQLSVLAVNVSSSITAMNVSFSCIRVPVIDVSPMIAALASITATAMAMAVNVAAAGQQAGSGFSGGMQSGLSISISMVRSVVSAIISTLSSAQNSIRSIGQKTGAQYTSAIQSGLSRLPGMATMIMGQFCSGLSSGGSRAAAVARSTSSSITSALRSASSGAYSSGYNIGIGLANGMSACLGRVRSVATQLAAAAEAAIRAKAQIHSPSKISDKLGQYWGEGYGQGIAKMAGFVFGQSEKLVEIPALASGPDISTRELRNNSLILSKDYDYSRNAYYTIIVPVQYDGREVARVTAEYTQEELEKRERRSNRKRGSR